VAGDRAFLKGTSCNAQSLNPSRLAAQAEIFATRAESACCRSRAALNAAQARPPVYELLVELGRDFVIRTAIETKVESYADRLSPELLRVTGGDRMPHSSLSGGSA
jgi:hypothetical protein